MKKKEIITDIITHLLVVLFIYAAVIKVLEFSKFTVQVSQSPILRPVAQIVPFLVPASEVVISIMLITTRWKLIGLYAAYALMLAFTLYIIAVLNFSEYVPCSCGGVLENMTWTQHLIFNSGFVLLAGLGIFLYEDALTSEII